MLTVTTSQGDVVIDPRGNRVGIKLSGGADSSIVAYMLAMYKKTVRDIDIVPVTAINSIKPWQDVFAKRVVSFIEKELDIEFCMHVIPEERAEPKLYERFQKNMMRRLYDSNTIDCHFNGVTMNPPQSAGLDPHGVFSYALERNADGIPKQTVNKKGNIFAPLANIDKKGVAELYAHYGLLDSLFPITKSCENRFKPYTDPHCGTECWWCLERNWGFGRLE